MKKLINVPMLHTPRAITDTWKDEDSRIPRDAIAFAPDLSPQFWQIVEEKLSAINVTNARFYMEGYSSAPLTIEAGTTHFPNENPNPPPEDKIILDFMKRVGGTLETTDSTSLIAQSLATTQSLEDLFDSIPNPDALTPEQIEEIRSKILEIVGNMEGLQTERNDEVAGNINNTLEDGETGFLFLGGSHDIKPLLLPDIHVELLDERLPEILREHREETERRLEASERRPPHGENGPEGKI